MLPAADSLTVGFFSTSRQIQTLSFNKFRLPPTQTSLSEELHVLLLTVNIKING